MAISTKPALVNYAKYPAVHWFTYYGLSAYLKTRGVECFDRFDMIDAERLPSVSRELVAAARAAAPLRFLGHVLTDATVLFGIKRAAG
jgi:2-polyprenyl-6-hydroxyphenyl methylase/3-demethylubiquinone-9 3-methyltransferase